MIVGGGAKGAEPWWRSVGAEPWGRSRGGGAVGAKPWGRSVGAKPWGGAVGAERGGEAVGRSRGGGAWGRSRGGEAVGADRKSNPKARLTPITKKSSKICHFSTFSASSLIQIKYLLSIYKSLIFSHLYSD